MKNNPLTDTTAPFVARLLNDLAGRGLEIYEQKTGLTGIKDILHPEVGKSIVNTVGHQQLPPFAMTLGAKIFDWIESGLGNANVQPNNSVNPMPENPVNTSAQNFQQPVKERIDPNSLKGAAIYGRNFGGGRTGRTR